MAKYYKAEDVERLIENVINVMIGKEEPIETALSDLPTIEVSDGEWVKDEYDIARCSECNCINNTFYRNYCPNCGARME